MVVELSTEHEHAMNMNKMVDDISHVEKAQHSPAGYVGFNEVEAAFLRDFLEAQRKKVVRKVSNRS
jgi:hypothetical protein